MAEAAGDEHDASAAEFEEAVPGEPPGIGRASQLAALRARPWASGGEGSGGRCKPPPPPGQSAVAEAAKGRAMFKELNEALPVVQRVLALVEAAEAADGEAITVVDLCSGIGYLSILLAELLRGSSKVARFVLVDSRWPMLNGETKPHHINPVHLQGGRWPFELAYRKYDLKSSSGQRQLQEHVVAQAPGPVALLGVHLCGVLSLHAVQFFNDHPRCTFLALKPCCLPPLTLAKQQFVWKLGGHSISAADVCAPGEYVRSRWTGPQRKSAQGATFRRWASSLFAAVDAGEQGHKELADFELVRVPEGQEPRYQTLFAFAERPYGSSLGSVRGIGGEPPIQPLAGAQKR
eukprot:CAMPEP_0175467124 /NCGR_PEP_ID=MMETSP0095-20121207/71158_1 /TAXON_ID=311494 /ORGANISM="Alexandrium monilatum, Strain CCMP3105" /LENGTH=347 /DNA_ID=CAMNT_0016768487 /DNA_START=44 /DNA_END=1084 /DNA_ORIENTATION=+